MKEKNLSLTIKTASDFNQTFFQLSEEQRAKLFDSGLNAQIPELIKTVTDFAFICESLTVMQRNKLFERLKTYLPERIETATDFQHVCQFLAEEQRDALFKSLKVKLPELIKNLTDFLVIFTKLSKKQQIELANGPLKQKLPEFIETASDFDIISKLLTGKQSYELFVFLEENRPEFVKTKLNLNDALQCLNEKQCQFFKTQFSLNAIQTKSQQVNSGLTRLFFKKISHQKRSILCEIAELANSIIQQENHNENSVRLDEIKKIVKDNQTILKTHRGFFKFHETTSNQIADSLVDRLESLVAINAC